MTFICLYSAEIKFCYSRKRRRAVAKATSSDDDTEEQDFSLQYRTNKSSVAITSECACGSQCGISDIEGARIIVLGACCKKSADSFVNVQEAVKRMGMEEKVVNIGDVMEIAKYGVMSTPALVIDSNIVAQGNLIKVEQAQNLLKKYGFGG